MRPGASGAKDRMIRRGRTSRRAVGAALVTGVLCALGRARCAVAGTGAAASERGAMINWANDVVTEAGSARGRDPVEANRVTLSVGGGPVIVQWGLSYDAYVNAGAQEPSRRRRARVHAVAGLEGLASRSRAGRWAPIRPRAPRRRKLRRGSRVRRAACSSIVRRAPAAGPQGLERPPRPRRRRHRHHPHHDLRRALI